MFECLKISVIACVLVMTGIGIYTVEPDLIAPYVVLAGTASVCYGLKRRCYRRRQRDVLPIYRPMIL
jgi:hypothetical protein